jgi:hypothetical protein
MNAKSRQLVKVPTADRALPVRLGAKSHQARHAQRPFQAPVSKKTALTTYYSLVVIAVALGVTAVYQWERYKDLAGRAAFAFNRNAQLSAHVEELEHRDERLLKLASEALRGNAQAVLAELQDLQASHPTLASAPTFAGLWASARQLDEQQSLFETASGVAEPPKPEPEAERPPAEEHVARPPEVTISAKEDSWVQIVDGGNPVFTKTLKPGDTYSLVPAAGTMLITGNAAGLDISVDGVVAPLPAKPFGRREIALDPTRLLAGTAEDGIKRAKPAAPAE